MVDQWKLAIKNLANRDEPAGELSDEMICPVDCLFWRQYQLPCRHLWHYEVVFQSFQESSFEIYKTSAKLDVEYEEVEGPDHHGLQMREVFESIKKKFYELVEHTADWNTEDRDLQIKKWLGWLQKLTGPIRSQGVEEALQEIKDEEARGKKRRRDDDNEDDGEKDDK